MGLLVGIENGRRTDRVEHNMFRIFKRGEKRVDICLERWARDSGRDKTDGRLLLIDLLECLNNFLIKGRPLRRFASAERPGQPVAVVQPDRQRLSNGTKPAARKWVPRQSFHL